MPALGTPPIVAAIVVLLFHWLYLRSSKERAFVRTGMSPSRARKPVK